MNASGGTQQPMAILAYRPTNMRFVLALAVASSVTALGISVFGAAPIVIVCVLLWLVAFFYRHPLSLVMLWLITLLHQVIFPDATLAQLGSSFTNLPILLLPMDVPYFFTLAYLMIKAATRGHEIVRAMKENPFLSLFLVIVVASTIMYTPLYGKSAIGEARKFFFHFFFPLLAVLSIKTWGDLRQFMLVIFFVAACISIVGYLQFVVGPSTMKSTMRVVSAQGSLILLFAVFSTLVIHINGLVIMSRAIDVVAVGLFLPIIIITHHRSVFLGGMLGLFLLFWLQRNKILFLSKIAIASIMLLTAMGAVFMNVPAFERLFMNAMEGIIAPRSDETASWRIEGWRQQLSSVSAKELLFGEGLGSYYRWFNRRTEVKADPHNAYVQIVLKFGLLGLVVYGLLVFSFFRKIFAVRKKLPPGPMRAYVEMSFLNLGAAHAYLTGYGFSLIILIFYAMGISAINLLQRVNYDQNHRCSSYLPQP
jgi:hypothetical protein